MRDQMKVLAVFLVLATLNLVATNDFNCIDVCGEYTEHDVVMKNLQTDCKAYHEDTKCQEKNVEDTDASIRRAKKDEGTRVVGGDAAKNPIPWMVIIKYINVAGGPGTCGGSLVNSRFVLTAAHCFCQGKDKNDERTPCSRTLEKLGTQPIVPKEDLTKLKSTTKIIIGASGPKNDDPNAPEFWTDEDFVDMDDRNEMLYRLEMFWIHPDLATHEEHPFTPDIMLIKLDREVKFTAKIKPICLAAPQTVDYPPCPDVSQDRLAKDDEKDNAWDIDGKMKGGCGIIAGWGGRYASKLLRGVSCMTQPAKEFPSRAGKCATGWKLGNSTVWECVTSVGKDTLTPDSFDLGCKEVMKEMNFQAATNKDWRHGDFNEVARLAPVQIIGWKRGNYTCSTYDMQAVRDRWMANNPEKGELAFKGWCATEVDSKRRIKKMGLCADRCKDERTSLNFAGINLLTSSECKYMFNMTERGQKNKFWPKFEMCGGKKSLFPAKRIVFARVRKSKKELRKDKKMYQNKKGELGNHQKPRKSKFLYQGEDTNFEGLVDGYPYNWYLGGVDTCQGDSGGPMWRNIKIGHSLKATQLGVVARGADCATFNSPGIYTRVSAIYEWIKETVKQAAGDAQLCPAIQK